MAIHDEFGASGEGYTRFQKKTVLVVDNEEAIAKVIARVIGKEYSVRACTDAEEAYKLLENGAVYDAIFCDVLMPGLGGPGFYQRLKKLLPNQAKKVIFITGAICLAETKRFFESVTNQCLDKPFTSDQLRAALREVVEM